MSDNNTFMTNNVFNKEISTINDYLKNIFINKDTDRQILSNINVDNFNEKRLKVYFVYTSKAILNNPIICKNIKYISEYTIEDSTSFSCWVKLSKMVENRESIGFPLIYKYIVNDRNNKYLANILFESNISQAKFNPVYDYTFSNIYRLDQIKFQKLLISYTLYKNNIFYSGKLIYDVYNILKTSITFKIQDLYFNFDLTTLVILSPLSKLYFLNGVSASIESTYILDVLEQFRDNTEYNFIEFFILAFGKYIDYNSIPTGTPIIIKDLEEISERPIRGTIVKIRSNNDKYFYGILVDYFDDIYKIYIISTSPKSTFNHIQFLNRNYIFKCERIIAIIKNYIIGKSEYCLF
ncbi:internal Virion Protein (Cop-L3L) [Choristoneura rosaceana entomopoxvirus 'L']|uniref:Internal Virion Protein (Cop-L3L) n=1 Tax=Choristoneura rosaceana entomopoxvirus 'L' TaxID=1293539 RepID=A0ABM9QKC2_9POXV|nr:internal Virion Protein (Cop-L3L) [Choristoneura rosaceana entomopoxvirus 'L']CCU55997.1 internal Virion Protein (Cop-L3L) [Choristoneura rosaceana entomopoxvirus 'L']